MSSGQDCRDNKDVEEFLKNRYRLRVEFDPKIKILIRKQKFRDFRYQNHKSKLCRKGFQVAHRIGKSQRLIHVQTTVSSLQQ